MGRRHYKEAYDSIDSMIIRVSFFLIATSTLALVHNIATSFFLYWKYPWFDIPMHFLGGVCVALGFSVLPFFRIRLSPRYQSFVAYLAFVFLVGTFWEIFELVYGISLTSDSADLIIDTAKDFFFDLIGGSVGYFMSKHISESYEYH